MIKLRKEGRRLYFDGAAFSQKDAIKAIKATFDGAQKCWYIGLAKEVEAQALVAQLNSQSASTPGDQNRPPADPDGIKLTGKGEYKGKQYYIGAQSKDGRRVRLLTLPQPNGTFLDFWADSALVQVIKTYAPKEYRGRTVYTTLGGIAAFVAKQQNPETRTGECSECGARGKAGETCHECHEGAFM